MRFHIDYQATPFGQQYSFEWHMLFEPDTLALNAHLEIHSYTTVTLLVLYWQNTFLPTAALVLQYVLNQANRQRLLPGLRLEDLLGLKILKYYVVRAPYVPQVIGTDLNNNQPKIGTLRLESSYR